ATTTTSTITTIATITTTTTNTITTITTVATATTSTIATITTIASTTTNIITTITTIATTTTSIITTFTTTVSTVTTTVQICTSSCVNTTIVSTSLVAFYTFDSVLTDSSGNGNTVNGTYSSFVTGYVNNAVSFVYANSERLTSSAVINLFNQSFTIDFWFYWTENSLSDYCLFGQCISSHTDLCLFLSIRKKALFFGFFNDDTPGNATIVVNKWYHAAFVYDYTNRIRYIYLNGVQDAIDTTTSYLLITQQPVNIGSSPIGGNVNTSVYYTGYIDHLMITQRAKTACEILQDATITVYYSFENSVIDSGPNKITGTISGTGTSFVTGGRVGTYALELSTAGSYFQTQSLTSLGITNQPFTIALWVRPTALSGVLIHISSQSNGML
ncbi:unnamed protein product, partial [Didymodactylos carnosus]